MMDAGDVVATLRTALPDLTARRDYREPLSDMVEACPVNDSFHGGMVLDEHLADEKTRYAVMRAYEILGEAVRHLPEPLKSADPEIPWTTMTAVRNRIVHGYSGIDGPILFTAIDEDLKPLLPRLEALARAQGIAWHGCGPLGLTNGATSPAIHSQGQL